MKHISHTEPFREVDNRNNFMLIKQELKRYEKELELKAGKGFLNSNTLDFNSSMNSNYPSNSMNNINPSHFSSQRNTSFLSEKRIFDEDFGNLSNQKSRKIEIINDYTSTVNNSKFQDSMEVEDFKIKKM